MILNSRVFDTGAGDVVGQATNKGGTPILV